MASTTLNGLSLSRGDQPGVGAALHELLVAFRHLATALWRAAVVRRQSESRAKTAAEEAEALRAYASRVSRTEPGFAADLCAAADRHEVL